MFVHNNFYFLGYNYKKYPKFCVYCSYDYQANTSGNNKCLDVGKFVKINNLNHEYYKISKGYKIFNKNYCASTLNNIEFNELIIYQYINSLIWFINTNGFNAIKNIDGIKSDISYIFKKAKTAILLFNKNEKYEILNENLNYFFCTKEDCLKKYLCLLLKFLDTLNI